MSFSRIAAAIDALTAELAVHDMKPFMLIVEGRYVRENLIGLARSEHMIVGTEYEAPSDVIAINGVSIVAS